MTKETIKQNIPKGWKSGKLGSFIIDIKDGGTPSRNRKEYFGGEIPWVVIKDIKPRIKSTTESLSQAGLDNSSAKLFPRGTVILSFGATIGEVGIAEIEVATKQGIAGVIYDKNVVDGQYLYFKLLSLKQQLHQLASGSTIKEVRPSVIKNIDVAFPSFFEQKKIAEILGVVDEKIQKTDEIIFTTEKLKRGLMQQLFTRGIGHTKFKKTKIGEIPTEWILCSLGKIFDVYVGRDLQKELFRDEKDNQHPFPIYANSLTNRGLYGYTEKPRYKRNAITITARGEIGKAVARNHDFDAIGRLLVLSPKNKRISCYFYAEYINSQINFLSEKTGVAQLTAPKITGQILPIPSAEEQKRIAEVLTSIDEKISINQKLKDRLTLLKKGLMQGLLSGNKRIIS